MSEGLIFTFERGQEFRAEFLPQAAPETIRSMTESLPLEKTVFHTRWCGREINVPLVSSRLPIRENQTSTAGFGDVIYWREWDIEQDPQEALGIYYGPELIRHHSGFLQVNLFARVPQEQWPIIEEVGLRVWQKGVEQVQIRVG